MAELFNQEDKELWTLEESPFPSGVHDITAVRVVYVPEEAKLDAAGLPMQNKDRSPRILKRHVKMFFVGANANGEFCQHGEKFYIGPKTKKNVLKALHAGIGAQVLQELLKGIDDVTGADGMNPDEVIATRLTGWLEVNKVLPFRLKLIKRVNTFEADNGEMKTRVFVGINPFQPFTEPVSGRTLVYNPSDDDDREPAGPAPAKTAYPAADAGALQAMPGSPGKDSAGNDLPF